MKNSELINEIQTKLLEIDGGTFQQLADAYLLRLFQQALLIFSLDAGRNHRYNGLDSLAQI